MKIGHFSQCWSLFVRSPAQLYAIREVSSNMQQDRYYIDPSLDGHDKTCTALNQQL